MANYYLSDLRSFEERVVMAMFTKSLLKATGSSKLSKAFSTKTFLATSLAFLHP